MAVDEMRDFLENGNIRNSVNYPNCDLGICKTGGRIAVFHVNKANMITQFTRVMGDAGVNISGMANQSRGEYAYTLLDIDNAASQEVIDGLREATGVYRVRVVK
jgi:D-3-phosphoglycerate dehydrogenase